MPPKAKQEAADPAVTMADVAALNPPAAAEVEVEVTAMDDEKPVFISAGMLHDIEQLGYAYDHVTRRKITAADAKALGYGITAAEATAEETVTEQAPGV